MAESSSCKRCLNWNHISHYMNQVLPLKISILTMDGRSTGDFGNTTALTGASVRKCHLILPNILQLPGALEGTKHKTAPPGPGFRATLKSLVLKSDGH